jgi:hypothetical protein
MKRIIIIAAIAAVVALGVGVTVGSTDQGHAQTVPQQTLPPGVIAAPQGGPTPEQLCEQAVQQLRAEHPDAHVSGCASGEGSIPTR